MDSLAVWFVSSVALKGGEFLSFTKKKDKKKKNVFVSRELDPAGNRGRTRGLFNDTKPSTDEDEDIFLGSSSTSAYLCV